MKFGALLHDDTDENNQFPVTLGLVLARLVVFTG